LANYDSETILNVSMESTINYLVNLLRPRKRENIVPRINLETRINDSLRVKAGKGLVSPFVWVVRTVLGSLSPSWARAAVVFSRLLYKLWKSGGVRFAVLYCKSCSVFLMQYAGGMTRVADSGAHGARVSLTRKGLPRCIPVTHRKRIESGDTQVIKIWVSLFSIYRVLSYPGKPKLSTIVNPSSRPLTIAFEKEWSSVVQWWTNLRPLDSLDVIVPAIISRSSPSLWKLPKGLKNKSLSSTSFLGIVRAAASLIHQPFWEDFVILAKYFYGGQRLLDLIMALAIIAPNPTEMDSFVPYVGKLGLKEEAAGKVRVFAMVDCFTQWLLRPLHKALFRVLRTIPMDGTFDQWAPVKRLLDMGKTRFWSFDLSAATDRLPLSIQATIVSQYLTGADSPLGPAWAKVLVARKYLLPNPPEHKSLKDYYGMVDSYVYYAVGQPMGALSSWAMLAMTHHIIVQLAAKRIGYVSINGYYTTDYALLGDDITITDGQVARSYRTIMAELDVQIGAHKSLISKKGSLEFAKRFIVSGKDCSAVPFKELSAAQSRIAAMMEYAKKYSLSLASVLTLSFFGFKAKGILSKNLNSIGKRVKKIGIAYYSPWGPSPRSSDLWFGMTSLIQPKVEWVLSSYDLLILIQDLELNRAVKLVQRARAKLHKGLDMIESWVTGWITDTQRFYPTTPGLKAWRIFKGPKVKNFPLYPIALELFLSSAEQLVEIRNEFLKFVLDDRLPPCCQDPVPYNRLYDLLYWIRKLTPISTAIVNPDEAGITSDVVRVDVNFALKQWEQVRRIMTYNPVPKYEAPVYEGKLLDTDALYEPFVSNYSFTDGVVEVFMLLNFTYESSMFDNYEYYPPAWDHWIKWLKDHPTGTLIPKVELETPLALDSTPLYNNTVGAVPEIPIVIDPWAQWEKDRTYNPYEIVVKSTDFILVPDKDPCGEAPTLRAVTHSEIPEPDPNRLTRWTDEQVDAFLLRIESVNPLVFVERAAARLSASSVDRVGQDSRTPAKDPARTPDLGIKQKNLPTMGEFLGPLRDIHLKDVSPHQFLDSSPRRSEREKLRGIDVTQKNFELITFTTISRYRWLSLYCKWKSMEAKATMWNSIAVVFGVTLGFLLANLTGGVPDVTYSNTVTSLGLPTSGSETENSITITWMDEPLCSKMDQIYIDFGRHIDETFSGAEELPGWNMGWWLLGSFLLFGAWFLLARYLNSQGTMDLKEWDPGTTRVLPEDLFYIPKDSISHEIYYPPGLWNEFIPVSHARPILDAITPGLEVSSVRTWESYPYYYDAYHNITSFLWRTREPVLNLNPDLVWAPHMIPYRWLVESLPNPPIWTDVLMEGDRVWPIITSLIF